MGCILRLLKAQLNAPRPSSKSFQRNNQDTSHASGARLRHRISRVPGLGAGLSSFPERLTLPEKKAAVALQTDHLVIGPGELDTDRGPNSPSQRISGRPADFRLFALCEREPLERLRTFRTEFFNDVSIAIQRRIDFE